MRQPTVKQFLDQHSDPAEPTMSRHVRYPVPGFTGKDAYFEAYLRNFGRNETTRYNRTILTIATVGIRAETTEGYRKLAAMEVSDDSDDMGVLHGTGVLRNFLNDLYVLAPQYGFRELAVEEVSNTMLRDVLIRYGFRTVEDNGFSCHLAKQIVP